MNALVTAICGARVKGNHSEEEVREMIDLALAGVNTGSLFTIEETRKVLVVYDPERTPFP